MPQLSKSLLLGATCCLFSATCGLSAELSVGAATVSITPDVRVAIAGQLSTRISQGIESPVTATALAMESLQDGQSLEQSVLVSCDVAFIPPDLLARTRGRVTRRLPDFPTSKLVLSATHTHTAPVL